MAKPKVFLSSTYYDLKSLRTDLEHFVREQGYDPVLFERGQISYGRDLPPEEYCHKEIENCDILVSIIGGKLGTQSHNGPYSISQAELKTALVNNKQVYIFIEKDVFNEYRTYNANKDREVDWQSVDNKAIFEFISEVYALPSNNAVMSFETARDVTVLLREQWAGLFQRLLLENSNQPSFSLVSELRQTLETSRKLVENLLNEKNEGGLIVQDILLTSHPIFQSIKKKMNIPYRVFFTSKPEISSWLIARGFKLEEVFTYGDDYFEWENNSWAKDKQIATLKVAKVLFDDDGNLKPIRMDQWKDEWVGYTVRLKKTLDDLDDDVPF